MSNKENCSKLIVFSAPSGAGKSTLAQMLLKQNPDHFALSISYTTRKPRGDEKHGEAYFFISDEEFQDMIHKNAFLEYAQVFHKHWYGTSKETVDQILEKGQSVLFDVDVQGAASLKKAYLNRCLTIFIRPPSMEVLENRLRKRQTDSDEAIQARLKTARQEMKEADKFDFQITNQDIQTTYSEIESFLVSEGCIER